MLDKSEMKLAMLQHSDADPNTKEPPLKLIKNLPDSIICWGCRERRFFDPTHEGKPDVNWLVHKLEKRFDSEKRSDIAEINRIVENAIHWCLVNGFVLVPKDRKRDEKLVVTYLPFTLLPSVLERDLFNRVFQLQPHINSLIYNLANSPSFLEKAFEGMIQTDEFLTSLWCTYKKSLEFGFNQKINLVILRTDFMVNECMENHLCMKQVEVNTIAAGFGYVGGKASQLHDEILKWLGVDKDLARMRVNNNPLTKLAQGFVEAWRLYNSPRAVVIFVVLDYEINIADQRHLEYEIRRLEPNIDVIRCTLGELEEFGYLRDDMTFFYEGREVGIVYFRAGYDPSHFKSQKVVQEWNALLKIEMSKAVKCPSLGAFLSGMKKIQEFISHEENLAQICNHDMDLVKSLMSTFVNFFKLDSKENIEKVYRNPENYVLKPQREGGGNNLYNTQIKNYLDELIAQEAGGSEGSPHMPNKNSFIVMDIIKPVKSENYIVSPAAQSKVSDSLEKLKKTQITNELGIFGVLVRNQDEIVMNETAGYCLRSKPATENESGVMCGSGALDSLLLID